MYNPDEYVYLNQWNQKWIVGFFKPQSLIKASIEDIRKHKEVWEGTRLHVKEGIYQYDKESSDYIKLS